LLKTFRHREKAKERMRRLRDRKKQAEVTETRSDVKEKRKQWRTAKARQIKNMTAEKRETLNRKRRERYIRKRAAAEKTIRVPEAPKDFAQLVGVLINGATPSQNMELLNMGICISPEQAAAEKVCQTLSGTFEKLKNSRKRADRRAMKDLVRATDTKDVAVYKLMGVRAQTWIRYRDDGKRKDRSDKLSPRIVEEVKQCYIHNSTPSSETKTVGKSGKQKRVLNMSTRRLHSQFMAASGYELSLSLFRKLRPKNILLVEANRFRTGLCEQCLNVTFKDHAFTGIGCTSIHDKYSLLDLSLCHKEDKPAFQI